MSRWNAAWSSFATTEIRLSRLRGNSRRACRTSGGTVSRSQLAELRRCRSIVERGPQRDRDGELLRRGREFSRSLLVLGLLG